MVLSIGFLIVLLAAHVFLGDIAARVLGIAGIGVWCAFRPTDNKRVRFFLCALVIPFTGLALAMAGLGYVTSLSTLRYDLYLHAIDHSLGFCPPQLAARLASSPYIFRIVVGLYQILPTMTVAGFGWAMFGRGLPARLFATYIISASSLFLYWIVPASGPGFVLGMHGLIAGHPSPQIALIHLDNVTNCIPSVHLSTAICIWFFNRSNTIARRASLGFVFCTAFATLALGEHYFIDLVMAFPFALFCISAATGQFVRAGISILTVTAWLVSIRLAIHSLVSHPVLLWSAAFATLLVSAAYLIFAPETLYTSTEPVGDGVAPAMEYVTG